MKEKLNKHHYMLLGIFIASIILLLPMFLTPYKENDDTWFHLMNINLIKTSIGENFWNGILKKIIPFVGNNLGYGTRLFYPPLAHTLASYLTYGLEFLNIDILTSLKIFHFLCLFLSGLTMYFCSYRFHKNKFQAFLSALIYISSSYHLCEIYVRDSLGENLLFIFLPLIIVSVKELLEGNKKFFYPLFIVGYVGGILSHFTMMIYVTLILGISMLFFYKKIWKKEFLIPFIKACAIVFLLTAFFFEPMIEHKLFGHYMVYQKWYMSWGIYHTTLFSYEYLFPIFSEPINFNFSIIVILLFAYVLIKMRKEITCQNYLLVTIFLGISFLMSTRLFFPWLFLPYMFFMIQFGWRLVMFVIFGVALLSPLAIKKSQNVYFKSFICVGIVLLGFILPENNRPSLDLNKINYLAIMGWQKEYLPESIGNNEENKKYYESRDQSIKILEEKGTLTILENKVPDMKFQIEVKEETEIEFPRFFYFGYTLKNRDNEKIPVYENEKGLLGAKVKSGTYELKYEGTKAYNICLLVSLTSFICVILYSLIWIIRKNIDKVKKK